MCNINYIRNSEHQFHFHLDVDSGRPVKSLCIKKKKNKMYKFCFNIFIIVIVMKKIPVQNVLRYLIFWTSLMINIPGLKIKANALIIGHVSSMAIYR